MSNAIRKNNSYREEVNKQFNQIFPTLTNVSTQITDIEAALNLKSNIEDISKINHMM